MAWKNTIETREDRTAIDLKIAIGVPLSVIARTHVVSDDALSRYRKRLHADNAIWLGALRASAKQRGLERSTFIKQDFAQRAAKAPCQAGSEGENAQ